MAISSELNLFKLCSKPLVGLLHSFAVHLQKVDSKSLFAVF